MMIGTAYFVDAATALRYYGAGGFTLADINRKLADKEIFIGKPPTKAGQRVVLIDNGTRYAVEWQPEGEGR